MNKTARLEIGDSVTLKDSNFLGTLRYFTGDGEHAFVRDQGGRFSKWPVKDLIRVEVQESKTEEKSDGDGL